MDVEIRGESFKHVIPGETIASEKKGFMAGWGTFCKNGNIISSVAGVVHTISKLVTVVPQTCPYKPDIGDVIIGRVLTVEKKSWRVNINAKRDASLNLTAINLPQGEQRRRSEEDAMQMRAYFEENDLLSGEIQLVHSDGGINIQTRNLKYGKLKNGILVEVNHSLIRKMKHHFVDLISDVKAILGKNGLIWIYYSTVKLDSEYFTDDTTKISSLNKHETPDEYAAVNIILFKNIVKSMNNHNVPIDQISMTKYYDLYIQMIEGLKGNTSSTHLDYLKRYTAIPKTMEKALIPKLITSIQNSKAQNILNAQKEFSSILNPLSDLVPDDEEDEGDEENNA